MIYLQKLISRRKATLLVTLVIFLATGVGAVTHAPLARASSGLTPGEGAGRSWCTQYGTSGVEGLYSFDGVDACGPDSTKGTTPFDSNANQSFQCVELVERFLWAVDGLEPLYGVSGVDGADLVSDYHAKYQSIAALAPGPTALPQPGDVMSFLQGGDILGSDGHTAVVVTTPDANGNFTIMSQNWSNTADEEPVHIDMSGGHNGEVQFVGKDYSSFWNSASFLAIGSASGNYGSFNRYRGPNGHDETVGQPPAGYSFEFFLGELVASDLPGTQQLYTCSQVEPNGGTDYFSSVLSNCEGKSVVHTEGYIYSSPPSAGPPTVPLYRCRVTATGTHFDSLASNCETQTAEGLLGYLVALNNFERYDGPNGHYASTDTAAPPPSGFSLEYSLGELAMTNAPGTQPLYTCSQVGSGGGTDYFTSLSSACEGKTVVRTEGYIYSTPQSAGPATVPLYRCRVTATGTHFDSLASNCENQTNDGFLGYLVGVRSWNRYVSINGHYETAGQQPAGYSYEEPLGGLSMTQLPGTQLLYSCAQGSDEFSSTASNCEGQTVIGPEGYIYTGPSSGPAIVPMYRCRASATDAHFDSLFANCEGQLVDGPLGYVIANGWPGPLGSKVTVS